MRSALHGLGAGLLRRTWFVAVVAVIACSAFAARAVAALVEADALAPNPHGVSPQPRGASASVPTRPPPDGSGLVARNMFCSTCDPAPGDPGSTSTSYSGKPAVLIATGVGGDPWATVRVVETEVQGSWSLGETIPGVGRIDRIGGISIDVVDADGHRAKLSLLDAAAAAGHGPGAATPVAEAAADPYADRIKKVDDHTFEVDRDLVRELVSGAAKPGKMRMIPIVKDGDVKGVRVFGVTPGTPAFAIGMKNSDIISGIDGEPIKTAQQLLDLYAKLDQLTSVELQGTRAGKPLAIALRLR
ncbi:MAG: PDZ domain-containing protein [Myxococcales bacterium]|nr:PDZ domain-containing protein [Myxococcales bacterium]